MNEVTESEKPVLTIDCPIKTLGEMAIQTFKVLDYQPKIIYTPNQRLEIASRLMGGMMSIAVDAAWVKGCAETGFPMYELYAKDALTAADALIKLEQETRIKSDA